MIELQEHRPEWAESYRAAAAAVMAALPGQLDAIEHIGSTAVPSLLAKPIIDLAARAVAGADPRLLDGPLSGLGYERHVAGPKNHAVFVREPDGCRTHLLHVFAPDQWEHCNQRLFRDRLLRDADARRRYRELKEALAGSRDGRDYTAGKLALVEELLNEERAARGLPPTSAWDE